MLQRESGDQGEWKIPEICRSAVAAFGEGPKGVMHHMKFV